MDEVEEKVSFPLSFVFEGLLCGIELAIFDLEEKNLVGALEHLNIIKHIATGINQLIADMK